MGGLRLSFSYMKTKRGIYHNLKDSEYVYRVDNILFYFSSKLYKDNFMLRCDSEIERFNQAANNIYKNIYNLDLTQLALIRLYVQIEKRGFYILLNGVEVECLTNLDFVLDVEKNTTTLKNLED